MAMSQDDILEGTSARTRPFSFDDIMLKRKNRGDTIKHVPCEISAGRDEPEKTFHSSERHRLVDKDFGSRDQRPVNDHRKVSSRRKEDTRMNEKLVQDRDKGSRGPESKLRSVVTKNVNSDRVTEDENERRHDRHRSTSKRDGLLSAHSDNRSDKRETRDPVRNDKVSERSREKSKIGREQFYDEDRLVSRKRKADGRVSSNLENEHEKKNAKDVLQTDKSADRIRDKSEKENRHKPHSKEGKSRGRSTVNEHDLEENGTKGRRAYLEESRPKRRRSPGREHDKERHRRSLSRSPKAHKHTSHDKRDHREPSSPSTKVRSGREHTEVDKQRMSSNGSGSHYRQNAGSSSGLGGYSPRKRKTDAAAKTPSPTHRSPDRRAAGWDLKPVEKEVIAGSTPTNSHTTSQNMSSNIKETPSVIPLAPSAVKAIENSYNTLPTQMHDIDSVQLTQATRPMRRLYVENLPASASDKDLIECINKSLTSSGVSDRLPCISCIIHKEMGQALLEFLTPEYATAALSLNEISFLGSILKLRRPKDYANITTGIPDKSMVAVDSTSTIVEDSPHKIFVGGISKCISSEMLLEIAKAFGPVKAYHYEFNDEPYAFLEYVDHSVTSKACAGLNGMKLDGQVVTAVFATSDTDLENVGERPLYGIPVHARPLLVKPSSVLKLTNVLDPERLLSLPESELEEVLEDIKLECSRFGTVKSVNVVKPKNSVGTTEADEVENTNAITNARDLEMENSSITDQLSQSLNEFGEADRSERPAALKDMENSSQTVESNNGCDYSADLSNTLLSRSLESDNLMNDNICKPPSADENITAREPSSHEESGYELECDDNVVSSISERNNVDGNNSLNGEELKLDENGAKVATLELEKREPDAPEGDKNDVISSSVEDVFERGSVFVEYKRAEAACTAAHCLHGRLFDGRVVTVGYVSHDLYRMRFN